MFNVKIKLPRFLLCGQEANIIKATREPHKWLFNELASRMLNTSESVLYFFHLWCFADKHVARIAFRRLNEVCSRQTFWSLRRCGRLIVLSVSFVPSAKTAAQSGAGFFLFSLNWVNSGRDSWGEAPLAASADVLNQKHCFALHKLVRTRASQPCFTLLPCLHFNDHIKIRKRFDFICFLSVCRVKPFVIILWDAVDIKVSWKEIKKIHKILFALSVLS